MFFNAYRNETTGLYAIYIGYRAAQSNVAPIKCGATDKPRLSCKVVGSEWTCSTCDGLDWEDDDVPE